MAAVIVLLAACGLIPDKTPGYRYRLTVEVETPDGLKTGSSVIEVDTAVAGQNSIPVPGKIYNKVRGEAPMVDLGRGRVLFALLLSDNDPDWASRVMFMLTPSTKSEPFIDQFDNMLALHGEIVLPRTFPPVGHLPERSAYPMLVTFGDTADPTSVERVDPDDLAANFGEGVRLKRITVEMTDDPVTTGIEKRLGWLSEYPEPRLDPEYRSSTHPNLSQRLWHGDFRKGQYQ